MNCATFDFVVKPVNSDSGISKLFHPLKAKVRVISNSLSSPPW
jgi:hypothetical protein